ncbi:hypothetical protein RhiirA4_453612 [Rhizophagus irregularis]|uniref:Uncharacterized protein n=1 Tax=Rhizophagus irregularis TaxID=588596 RepID=A0A2I1G0V5_9GLOM|nr:hypothetical protein RhiirA4_453612 [Rhizophagus irregularis]
MVKQAKFMKNFLQEALNNLTTSSSSEDIWSDLNRRLMDKFNNVLSDNTDTYDSRAGRDIVCLNECNVAATVINKINKDKKNWKDF